MVPEEVCSILLERSDMKPCLSLPSAQISEPARLAAYLICTTYSCSSDLFTYAGNKQ